MVDFANRGATVSWFQHLGGATSRVAPDATAFAHRNVAMNFGIEYSSRDPAQNEAGIAAVREFYYALEPHMVGFYTNLHIDTENKTWGNYGPNYPANDSRDTVQRCQPTRQIDLITLTVAS